MDNLTKKRIADIESLIKSLEARSRSAKGSDFVSIQEELRRQRSELSNLKNWNS